MSTYLVTGGNGFLGRTIVEQLLARGDTVRVAGRGSYPELSALGVRCYRIDLAADDETGVDSLLTAAMQGCAGIVHTAAHAGVWGPRAAFYAANVLATRRVLAAAARAGVPKLVFTSSPSVVFGEESVEGADESLPYPARYLAAYPYTKALAEREVLAEQRLLTTAIRPPLIWGARDPHLLPRLITRAHQGRLAQVGDGTNRADVTYVENAAAAHLLALDALAPGAACVGRAYFIGQEQPVNLWQFIGTILAHAGAPPVRHTIPYALAARAAHALEVAYHAQGRSEEPPLTRLSAASLARSRWFDLRAARRDLGYEARIPIAEGLRRTFETRDQHAVSARHD